MANEEHLKILIQGVDVLNRCRDNNPEILPDLIRTFLRLADLGLATRRGVVPIEWNLRGVDLSRAKLSGVNLGWAHLIFADLTGADLRDADLSEANLGAGI